MSSDSSPVARGESTQLKADANAFVAANLQVLARELLDWRRTGVLRGDKLRELADRCRGFTIGDDELQTAEYLVQMAALARVAAAPI